MDVTVTVTGSPEDGAGLREWLADQDELAGRVRPVRPVAGPGQLGSIVDTLAIALGPGGAAVALAAALVTWIRHGSASVRITVKPPGGGEIELAAERVRGLDPAALREVVAEVTEAVRIGAPADAG
jgi:hypothetical protein